MKVAISGASGLVGSALVDYLTDCGHEVYRLQRRSVNEAANNERDIHYEPNEGRVDEERLAQVDAVVHLAGENIIGRWTAAKRKRIIDSRVNSTRTLAHAIGRMESGPHIFISASAVGYYGDRQDEELTEGSDPGENFIAEVCQKWEEASDIGDRDDVRVVNIRIGLVLSKEGGALGNMLGPFKWGVGGKVGSGRQYMSWISMRDMVRAIGFLLENDGVRGPVNMVGPAPATNLVLTRALGKTLGRPTILPLPGFAVKLMFGQMGKELLLGGSRVLPVKLLEAGFEFEHRDIASALEAALSG